MRSGKSLKISSGFFRNLVGQKWDLEVSDLGIRFSINKSPSLTIPFLDLQTVTIEEGIISNSLNVQSMNHSFACNGVSLDDANGFIERTKQLAGIGLASMIDSEKYPLLAAYKQFQAIGETDFYLNQSRIAEIRESLPESVKLFEHPYFDISYLQADLKRFANEYGDFLDPDSTRTQARNNRYVAKKLNEYESLFDTVEKYPLTQEQRTAIVTEEDNILLIAAAGSGKSSTLVGKILYLLKEGKYKPDELIALAFNRDAKKELSERIDNLFKRFNWSGDPVPARTFHGFCMDVIAEVTHKRPTIAAVAKYGKAEQTRYFTDLVTELRTSDPHFHRALLTYYAIFKFPKPRDGEIRNKREYENYLYALDGKGMRDPNTGEWVVLLKAMNGLEVKSLEELAIANWLIMEGVNFEYEKRYDIDTATTTHRQYYPDFYYPDADLWHEHFALDKNDDPPAHFKDYKAGVFWKRELHDRQETLLVETHSAHFSDGTVFEKLDTYLKEHNVTRTPPGPEQLDKMIDEAFNPDRDLELVITFLKHVKTNNLTLEEVETKARSSDEPLRASAFLNVFRPVYHAYQSRLYQAKEIDFEDLMHMACDLVEAGEYKSPFRYILVDEFQDASQDRLRLIKALAAQQKHSCHFAVGDDWQSIYRFAGADLRVMTGFPGIFGYTKQLQLTETFRSFQQIVDVAQTFIQKNPAQFKKDVKAQSSTDKDPVILKPYDPRNPDKAIEDICQRLNKVATENKATISVFVLTRYRKQEPRNIHRLNSSLSNITVEWKTIHESKGLEADYVILQHLNGGRNGFPCEQSDDNLLELVMPEWEIYPHAEERRLLYVALTRARKAFFGFYDKERASPFVNELSEIEGVKVMDTRYREHVSSGDQCPKCGTGVLGNRSSSWGAFLACSNYPECEYTTDIHCPECKIGQIVQRKAHNSGRTFYACNRYPKCDHIYRMR